MSREFPVGAESTVHRQTLGAERFEGFARAVGSTVRDEAPPTFMTTLRSSEFELFDTLGIPLQTILHAEQEYSYSPEGMPVGCQVEFRSRLKSVNTKRGRGSSLSFMAFETEFMRIETGKEPRWAGSSLTTIVVRGEAAS